jgi:hypothetical protein
LNSRTHCHLKIHTHTHTHTNKNNNHTRNKMHRGDLTIAKSIQICLSVISISVVVLFLLAEQLSKRNLFILENVIFLPAGDFVDMFIMTPIFFVAFWFIHYQMFRSENKSAAVNANAPGVHHHMGPISDNLRLFLYCLSAFSLTVFIYGCSMHTVANAIHTVFTERRPHSVPKEHLSLMYFFDETFSHILIMFGWYSMMMVWTLAQNPKLHSFRVGEDSWKIFAIANGIFTGLVHTLAFIEGDCPKLGLFLLCPLTLYCVITRYNMLSVKRTVIAPRKGPPIKVSNEKFICSPISTYTFFTSITVILGELLYYFRFGSWTQPSERGGMACLMLGIGCPSK